MENNHETNTLQHHGVKGQKWGVRRYQNKDGSLTALGEKRMGQKSGADKKLREDLKDRRSARRITIAKEKQAMRQEALDRANARKLARGKLELEKQRAREDSMDKENARKIAQKDQKDRSMDKENARDIAKQKIRMELESLRNKIKNENKQNTTNSPKEEYYELPTTAERQLKSRDNGKKWATAAMVAAGAITLGVFIKKYGPSFMDGLGGMFDGGDGGGGGGGLLGIPLYMYGMGGGS